MTNDAVMPPLAATDQRVYRLIASIYPTILLFEQVTEPEDLDDIYALEAMTNERLRQEAGDISLVPLEDRVVGPGSSPIMAAFTHLNRDGARFSDASFGAYYAGYELSTAIAETKHHREAFLRRTKEGPIDIDMRCYVARLRADLHDLRPWHDHHPELFHSTNYSASQTLARTLRAKRSMGIIYPSVRATSGTCVAVLRPICLSNCREKSHLTYRWDGKSITDIYEKKAFIPK